ncbi:MAG: insulinase family protein [Bacillota bacterium]|nr:insulinase family protein [Bacillota bacterium]
MYFEGKVTHGFRLCDHGDIPEIGSTATLYEHEKTGARLLVLANDDRNKVFGIGFRTPPSDNSGVAHIVEHCVLSGSRRYHTKEPFMDLYSGSLQTFLNAMTYPDKTLYPVASRNDRDFRNLASVYLDSVFYPRMYEDERIFAQEGWHYELNEPDGELGIRGVVYNEMKGAYSDPRTRLQQTVNQTLLPDTAYANESGGNPDAIPSLSYEAFLDFHRRYYHPSNAWLYLYGDMDVEDWLGWLDGEWLGDFERLELDSRIAVAAAPDAPRYAKTTYPSDPADDSEAQDYVAWAAATPAGLSPRDRLLLALISDLLFESQSAPVRIALLQSGLSADVSSLSWDAQQGVLGIAAIQAKPEAASRVPEIVESVLAETLAAGLPEDRVTAALNRLEYSLRECDGYPTRGLIYFIRSFDLWLYDGDPLEMLRFDRLFAEVRAAIPTGIVEEQARRWLLENPHRAVVHMTADPGQGARHEAELAASLEARRAAMTPAEHEAVCAATAALAEWQLTPDSPEARATIPRLELGDIDGRLENPGCRSRRAGDLELICQPVFASGIYYIQAAWALPELPPGDLSWLALVSLLIGSVGTRQRDYRDLDTAVYLASGGISVAPTVFEDPDDPERLDLRIVVTTKCTGATLDSLVQLLPELLLETDFTDVGRIRELVSMARTRLEQQIMNSGSSFAARRARSYSHREAAVSDRLSGIEAYVDLTRQLDMLDSEAGQQRLVAELERVYRRLFVPRNCLVIVTGDPDGVERVAGRILPAFVGEAAPAVLAAPLKEGCERSFICWEQPLELQRRNEGIGTTSEVQYVAQTFDLGDGGLGYDGRAQVLSTWLSLGYLHNEIRAQGGAYGCGATLRRNGTVDLTSYRDPHLERTFGVYESIADRLESFCPARGELDSLIIGSVNRFDPPMTPALHGTRLLAGAITGRGVAELEASLAEALAMEPEDFARFAPAFRAGVADRRICVVGGMERIREAGHLFGEVRRLRALGREDAEG